MVTIRGRVVTSLRSAKRRSRVKFVSFTACSRSFPRVNVDMVLTEFSEESTESQWFSHEASKQLESRARPSRVDRNARPALTAEIRATRANSYFLATYFFRRQNMFKRLLRTKNENVMAVDSIVDTPLRTRSKPSSEDLGVARKKGDGTSALL